MILEVKPDCVGEESTGRIGGVAVDLEARAAADEAAVSSFLLISDSLCRDDGPSGEERRPVTAGG